jgi:cholesterol 24(S)-hydroxylase
LEKLVLVNISKNSIYSILLLIIIHLDFDFNAIGDKENEWVKTYDVVNTGFVDPLFFMFPVLEAYFLWLFPKRRQAHQDLVKFQGMIRGVIEEKRGKIESGENQNENLDDNEKDLLTLMLESEMKGEGKMTDTELEVKKKKASYSI